MNKRALSLHEFKNWLSEQKDLSDFFNIDRESTAAAEQFIGKQAVAKVSEKKLLQRIEGDNIDPIAVVQEFLEDGGTIVGIDGKNLLIETTASTFYLPRFCVRIKD